MIHKYCFSASSSPLNIQVPGNLPLIFFLPTGFDTTNDDTNDNFRGKIVQIGVKSDQSINAHLGFIATNKEYICGPKDTSRFMEKNNVYFGKLICC